MRRIAKQNPPNALEIILTKCGLISDVIGEICKWLPKCKHCGRSAFAPIMYIFVYWYRKHHERTEFVSIKYYNNHRDEYKYKHRICYYNTCYNCRIPQLKYILRANYDFAHYKHNIDDKIIKFSLADPRLHRAIIEIFTQECDDKLWIYLARYKHLSGQPSHHKRKFHQLSLRYINKRQQLQSQ